MPRPKDIVQEFHDMKLDALYDYEQILELLNKSQFDKARIALYSLTLQMNYLQACYEKLTGKGDPVEKV